MIKQVRFWYYINGGYVKLTVAQDQPVYHSFFRRTDEGYCSADMEFSYDGEKIYLDIESRSVDCDGRMDGSRNLVCTPDKLRANDVSEIAGYPMFVPVWERLSERQRDYSAERMGY